MKVFVGYDTREDIAYQVCKHSLEARNANVEVIPLVQNKLREQGYYTRPVDKLASTEFTFTRFLMPELTNFNGWALFCDSDIIFLNDVKELFDQADDKYAVMCAKHDYTPKEGIKMDGQTQTVYPRKNWSSVMLVNCGHPSNKQLDMKLVNDKNITGAYLRSSKILENPESWD